MSTENSNEITVKVKCKLEELYNLLENKGFQQIDRFHLDDTYMIPASLNTEKIDVREILSKAILVREVQGLVSGKIARKITFKIKDIDSHGNILSQQSVSCEVASADDAKNLLKAIGYKKIMNIKEFDTVYKKDKFQLSVKDIENGDNLIEVDGAEQEENLTIEEMIQAINEAEIPICTDNYFVKKAEIELKKVLNRV